MTDKGNYEIFSHFCLKQKEGDMTNGKRRNKVQCVRKDGEAGV